MREQPDLNWENPDVREAVWELMLWWLRRGADGFRVRLAKNFEGVHYSHGKPLTDGCYKLNLKDRRVT